MAMSERLKKALMIFIKQSLAGCALSCNHALIAIEDWHINSYAKTIRVHIGGVAGARERHRQLRKLGEDGSAHGWILALVALAQSQKIKPARLDICQQLGFIGRLEVCGQREPGAHAHVCFRFDAERLIQTKPLMREILFERKHDRHANPGWRSRRRRDQAEFFRAPPPPCAWHRCFPANRDSPPAPARSARSMRRRDKPLCPH